MAFQTDGKFLVGGTYISSNGDYDFALVRHNPDGSLDTTFGSKGKVVTNFGNNNYNTIHSIYVLADGKIMVIGASGNTSLTPRLAIVRYASDGTLDAGFAANGKLISPLRLFPPFSSLRFTSNGAIDPAYGTNGSASSYLPYDYRIINNILLQPEGKFLVALSLYNQAPGMYDFKIRRFNPDGTPDADFGGLNGLTTSFFNGYDEAFSIGLQSDGRVIVAGNTNTGINNDVALIRYTNEMLNVPGFESDSDLLLYPNPVNAMLTIKTKGIPEPDIRYFSIYTMQGQLIHQSPGDKTTIDTQDFASGIYILTLTTKNGSASRKFIKN